MNITCNPPYEEASFIESFEKKLERFATERPITAVITGVALAALAIASLIVSAPTTWSMIALVVVGGVITEVALRVITTTAKQWSHLFFEKVILPILERRGKQPPPHPLPHVFAEREVETLDGDRLLGRLFYQTNDKEPDHPIVELYSTDSFERGFTEGLLLAPQIDELYRRYTKPLMMAAAKKYDDPSLESLKDRVQHLPISTQHRQEIHGLAEGIKEYTRQTGNSLSSLNEEALLMANIFADVYPTNSNRIHGTTVYDESSTGTVVGHNVSLPSKGILGKYLFIRRTLAADSDGDSHRVEMLSYPGNIGLLVGKHANGRLVTYTGPTTPIKDNAAIDRLVARQILDGDDIAHSATNGIQVVELGEELQRIPKPEQAESVKHQLRALDSRNTVASVLFEGDYSPEYQRDNYFAASRFK